MSKWTLASYNRFLGASMSRYGLARKQAAQHYREMRSRLDRPVTRADVRNHPRIAKQTAARAFAKRIGAPTKPPIRKLPPPGIPEEVFEELEEGEEEQDQEVESSEDYES
jgi:hypothetical protein